VAVHPSVAGSEAETKPEKNEGEAKNGLKNDGK
jgi:hypothetical protein